MRSLRHATPWSRKPSLLRPPAERVRPGASRVSCNEVHQAKGKEYDAAGAVLVGRALVAIRPPGGGVTGSSAS
jgi:hypothetical protein